MSSRTASAGGVSGSERRRLVAALLLLWLAGLAVQSACSREDGSRRNRRVKSSSDSAARGAGVRPAENVLPAPPAAAACGSAQPWDRDGDGISDAVEDNNRAFGHAFSHARCDRDPSKAVGRPSSGRLSLGINLTDRGPGYLHYLGGDQVDTDDWGTLPLVACIEAVGRAWESTGIPLSIGNLSRRAGGSFYPPHTSHQNGLDADARYVRLDGRADGLDIKYQSAAYDPVTTRALINTFIELCPVQVIFTHLDYLQFTNDDVAAPVLMTAAGHTNHFHVRLKGGTP